MLVVVEEEQQLLDQVVEQEEQEDLVAAVLVELNLVHLEVVMVLQTLEVEEDPLKMEDTVVVLVLSLLHILHK